MYEVLLVLALPLAFGAALLTVFLYGSRRPAGGTVPNPRPPSRSPRELEDDLIDKLRRVRWAQATMKRR